MKKSNKIIIDDERKLRNITDYIFSCINRLSDNAELLLYLGRHKANFIDNKSKSSMSIIISMFDQTCPIMIQRLNNIFQRNPLISMEI